MSIIPDFFPFIFDALKYQGDWYWIYILSLIQIPPAILCFKNYRILKSRVYLLVSLFFIDGIINKTLVQFVYYPPLQETYPVAWSYVFFFMLLTGVGWGVFFILLMFEMKWNKPPRILKYPIFFYASYLTFSSIILTLDGLGSVIATYPLLSKVTPLFWDLVSKSEGLFYLNLFNLWFLFTAILGLYVYITMDYHLDGRDEKIVKSLWIFVCVIVVLEMILSAVFTYIGSTDTTRVFTFGIMHLTFAYVAFRYPQAFLITESQIMRAIPLYEAIKKKEDKNKPSHYGTDKIFSYLESLPQHLRMPGEVPPMTSKD